MTNDNLVWPVAQNFRETSENPVFESCQPLSPLGRVMFGGVLVFTTHKLLTTIKPRCPIYMRDVYTHTTCITLPSNPLPAIHLRCYCLTFTPTLVPQHTIYAEEGTLWPSPRAWQDHPLDKAVPNTRSSSRRATRHDSSTPESNHLRYSAAADGNRHKGRPLSGDGDDAGWALVGDNGDGGGGERSDTINTTSRVPPPAAWNSAAEVPGNLSGPNEHNRQQGNINNGVPDGNANRHRHGQRPPSATATATASHRVSKSDRHAGRPDEAAGEKGGKGGNRISWGAPARELVERTSARSTAATTNADDAAFRNNNRPRSGRGEGDGHPHPRRDGAQKEEAAGGRGHSTAASTEKNEDDHFARGRPGDRYYLPPPPRNSRPRTSPDETGATTTPRQSDKRRDNFHQRPGESGDSDRRRNRSVSGRGGGGGSDSTNPPWSSAQPQRRERRRSSSSDRLYGQQPEDNRPMLGASEASGASHMPEWRYGWRGSSSSNAASFSLSQEEESLPYYVDRKQVCVCVCVSENRKADHPSSVRAVQMEILVDHVVLARVPYFRAAAAQSECA